MSGIKEIDEWRTGGNWGIIGEVVEQEVDENMGRKVNSHRGHSAKGDTAMPIISPSQVRTYQCFSPQSAAATAPRFLEMGTGELHRLPDFQGAGFYLPALLTQWLHQQMAQLTLLHNARQHRLRSPPSMAARAFVRAMF